MRMAGYDSALFAVNHFQQNHAREFAFGCDQIHLAGNGEIELQLQTVFGFAKVQLHSYKLGNIRHPRLQINDNGDFPIIVSLQDREQICFRSLGRCRNRPSRTGVAAVNDELT